MVLLPAAEAELKDVVCPKLNPPKPPPGAGFISTVIQRNYIEVMFNVE